MKPNKVKFVVNVIMFVVMNSIILLTMYYVWKTMNKQLTTCYDCYILNIYPYYSYFKMISIAILIFTLKQQIQK